MANNIATEQKQAGNEAARAVKVAVVSRLQAMVSTHGRRLINPRFKNFSTPRTRISLLASLQTRYPSPSILGWLIVHKRLETIRQRRNLRSTRVCVQPPWFSLPSLFLSYPLLISFGNLGNLLGSLTYQFCHYTFYEEFWFFIFLKVFKLLLPLLFHFLFLIFKICFAAFVNNVANDTQELKWRANDKE